MLGGVSYSVPVGVGILPKLEHTSKGGCVKTEIVCSCYALWLNFTAPLGTLMELPNIAHAGMETILWGQSCYENNIFKPTAYIVQTS